MKYKTSIWISLLIVYSVVLFFIGFSLGNLKFKRSNSDDYVNAIEEMLRLQGDKPESIEATLNTLKAQRAGEMGSEVREHVAIWLPSLLVVINILVTILIERQNRKFNQQQFSLDS